MRYATGLCALLIATTGVAGDKAAEKPAPIHLRAGPQATTQLTADITAKDHELFAAVFDTCDADKLRSMVTDDLEFFHDKDGLSETSGAKFADDIRQHCERIKTGVDFRARREIVAGSIEVYPLNNYGAVETGVHRFYAIVPGKPDRLTETAQFLHVWKNDGGQWKLARVISYNHTLADQDAK
jgi:Domain of unknown function (DUF4440)